MLPTLLAAGLFAFTGIEVGSPLPEFQSRTSTGVELSSASLKGKVVLVEVWASYCTVCRAQFPILRQLDKDYRDRGLRIVGVSMDTDIDAFDRAIQKETPSWPQICEGKGPAGELARRLRLDHTPGFYLVGRNGKIVSRDLLGDQLRAAVIRLMEEQ
ncbi:MAG: TlpA family protein disulfide reductase [Deltaproteobacteria bacterium]|nr:TlpA family protein disulfide reductase [Deltaproteobacteria bacterium]